MTQVFVPQSVPLALSLSLVLSLTGVVDAQKKKPGVFTDAAAAAAKDPGFLLQGEYAMPQKGIQIIALGGDRFRVVTYPGGLPGLGWSAKTKDQKEVSGAEARAAVADGFQKIQRRSTTLGAKPPAGATVLFDGTKAALQNWKKGARMNANDHLMAGVTSLPTFGDALVHVEFLLPYKPQARGQGRGNSGVYAAGRYEVQVLDSYGLEGLDNECGGIYKIGRPYSNMCAPPGQWQSYDMTFKAAKFDNQGTKTDNALLTVVHNGVTIHDDRELPGPTGGALDGNESAPGGIFLQDHSNPVQYRNIWIVEK
jgi:hypothetical protein